MSYKLCPDCAGVELSQKGCWSTERGIKPGKTNLQACNGSLLLPEVPAVHCSPGNSAGSRTASPFLKQQLSPIWVWHFHVTRSLYGSFIEITHKQKDTKTPKQLQDISFTWYLVMLVHLLQMLVMGSQAALHGRRSALPILQNDFLLAVWLMGWLRPAVTSSLWAELKISCHSITFLLDSIALSNSLL